MKKLLFVLALAFSGCATQPPQVTYHSDPPGAMLYDANGLYWGRTPVTLAYPGAVPTFRQGQCTLVVPVNVRWTSGATAAQQLRICPAQGLLQQFVFVRPDEPGREIDAQFAVELARQSASAAPTSSSSDTATLIEAARQLQDAANQRRNVNCSSQTTNGVVHTTCY